MAAANRVDEGVLAAAAEQRIAFVPYFPLGGFSPLQSDVLDSIANRLGATPTAVALSWLLQHSPNIMLIPGTSSVDHLRQNIAGAALALPRRRRRTGCDLSRAGPRRCRGRPDCSPLSRAITQAGSSQHMHGPTGDRLCHCPGVRITMIR